MQTFKAEFFKNGDFYTIRIKGLGNAKTRFADKIQEQAEALVRAVTGSDRPFTVELTEVDR